ncbi:SDR family NAD(P)-dependent oxidoreductase [Sunxiuqinia elliptica]|uniref:3-oxoacyl-[acyl-carrier protein] reductase/7-alpha-hydroxysteroid dehydrogenase n=1 Tax=Sunxiuqinia elliptica TaxID=655355 RepID=A0A1I2BXA4_9BACT|nr:glucose 1-dehydrogenase [Sunxiuqinia elliptica]SFE60731.1 3-oxoacyl-[acyl-carrier protein] reductase/7-alpha-hydroxysteroid dehydrogenase [Sunxiuqinia elliptica]
MKKLNGKVALVTGASKGIGAEIARSLANAGANVIVNYFTDQEGGHAVVADIVKNGGTAIAVQADVTKSLEVKKLFEKTIEEFGKLDILINNAGVYTFEPIEQVTEEIFQRQFDHNVLSVVLTIQEAMKHFSPELGGNIVNISSVASVMPTPRTVVYSATKSAVDSITRTLAKELGALKIRINSILPGPTQTSGNQIRGTEMENFVVANTPLGRIGEPRDIASLAVFLASEEASWLTGQKIAVSGGFE